MSKFNESHLTKMKKITYPQKGQGHISVTAIPVSSMSPDRGGGTVPQIHAPAHAEKIRRYK